MIYAGYVPGVNGSPFTRAAQLPPYAPPGTLRNSVVILTLFGASFITCTPPSRGSYSVQVYPDKPSPWSQACRVPGQATDASIDIHCDMQDGTVRTCYRLVILRSKPHESGHERLRNFRS